MTKTFEYHDTHTNPHSLVENVLLDVISFLKKHGVQMGKVYVFKDPDETFMALMNDKSVQVWLYEGEAKGDGVFHYRLLDKELVNYERGPWENRIRAML